MTFTTGARSESPVTSTKASAFLSNASTSIDEAILTSVNFSVMRATFTRPSSRLSGHSMHGVDTGESNSFCSRYRPSIISMCGRLRKASKYLSCLSDLWWSGDLSITREAKYLMLVISCSGLSSFFRKASRSREKHQGRAICRFRLGQSRSRDFRHLCKHKSFSHRSRIVQEPRLSEALRRFPESQRVKI